MQPNIDDLSLSDFPPNMNIINSEIGDRPSFVGLTPFSEKSVCIRAQLLLQHG